MQDITKTRMLLTTVVFAAVAALFAAGANARIPADTGSAFAAQESLRIGAYASQPPSWRRKGGKGEETGGATNPLQRTGVARRAVATAPAFPSGPLLDTPLGTAMATRTAETAQASIGIAVEAQAGHRAEGDRGERGEAVVVARPRPDRLVPCLEHQRRHAMGEQGARGGQAGLAATDHDGVVHLRSSSERARARRADR